MIVDDHAVVRAGLVALLAGEDDLAVVGECSSTAEALSTAARTRPDVVLMDLRLEEGGEDGVEATRRLLDAVPGVAVVVLTSYGGRSEVLRAVEAGARGYVLKAGPPEELFRAVRSAAAGGLALGAEAVSQLVGQVTDPGPELSDREVQVVRLLARGLGNRAIAELLFVTEATVKTHLVRLYRKLGTGSRTGAVSEAVRRGIIDLR